MFCRASFLLSRIKTVCQLASGCELCVRKDSVISGGTFSGNGEARGVECGAIEYKVDRLEQTALALVFAMFKISSLAKYAGRSASSKRQVSAQKGLGLAAIQCWSVISHWSVCRNGLKMYESF